MIGNISYDPINHERMCALRAEKIERIAQDIPPAKVLGESSGKVLVVGWGSTYGAIVSVVEEMQKEGKSVSCVNLRHLSPLYPPIWASSFKNLIEFWCPNSTWDSFVEFCNRSI